MLTTQKDAATQSNPLASFNTRDLITGQMKTLTPTNEQLQVATNQSKTLIVRAFAGTGKTTALICYSLQNPHLRMTYLAFNAAIKEEAKLKFPPNVHCVTAHGLAYKKYGLKYGSVKDKLNNPKPYHVSNAFNLTAKIADIILKIVFAYLASTDLEISEKHAANLVVGVKESKKAADFAKKAWRIMQDPENMIIPMPHDGYLKLYQISGDNVYTDVILFDETQDASPIMLAIVEKSNAMKVFVGDEHQAIYSFRGAVNAMDEVNAQEQLYLTASFRFGAGLASLANSVLSEYRHFPKPLKGLGKKETEFSVNYMKPHTRLARTNACLFDEAVKALEASRTFGFVGGVANYGFNAILDTYHLFSDNALAVTDPSIKPFKTFADMQGYAEMVDDKELKSRIRVVTEYRARIPELVQNVKQKALEKEQFKFADIKLATAHKSKGLEWDSVHLTDDFTDMIQQSDGDAKDVLIAPDKEEINLLYVAITRAERCISVHPRLYKWLEQISYFEPIQHRHESIPRLS